MENKFLNAMSAASSAKLTENGQPCVNTTGNSVLDLFAQIGALRGRDLSSVYSLFAKAYGEDRLATMRMLFYCRDVREGLGERDTFRNIAKYLALNHPKDIELNMNLIPEYGRWDDLYCFVGTTLEDKAFSIMKDQYIKDLQCLYDKKPVSLLGKWLKSVNTSSEESNSLGRKTAKYFGETEKRYRTLVSALRKSIDVVEKKMSSKDWDNIDFSKVPSNASLIYKNAFFEHSPERYKDYLDSVENGDAKINSAVLYPYDLVSKYWKDGEDSSRTIEAQWKALPNYITEGRNFLVMADVSGSMAGTPMATAIGLAIYFAEHCKGIYHNNFLTFSEVPEMITLKDDMNLYEKINEVRQSNWGMNTDLDAAFSMILNAAIKSRCAQSDLPAALVVITDMEIDECTDDSDLLFVAKQREQFKNAGYKMPILVWWNARASASTFHNDSGDKDVRFVSGNSPTVFKDLVENMGSSSADLMGKILSKKRYAAIRIAE